MTSQPTPLGITEVVLRDANQSLLATRLRLEDMLPIAQKLDDVGYSAIESWGGATFDACIRFLNEDPWERLQELKKAMPKTPQQMLLRGQNLLGYRHFSDDVVEKFIDRAAFHGIDIFRIFDALNDVGNLKSSIRAVKQCDKHAQVAIAYTVSPVHTIERWLSLAHEIEDSGADSLCIKDMAGLLMPYAGYELVSKLKQSLSIPIHLHSHATTGLSTATIIKCAEAGVDSVDCAISSMSMTSGHSATESVIAMLKCTDRDTNLDLEKLRDVAKYFADVRSKYSEYESALRGVNAEILNAQIPGGMLTNMENQLKQQKAEHRFHEVLNEAIAVREDFGFVPLVTPASQIVGSQAILNILTGQRYKILSQEACSLLRGEYGTIPAPVNEQLLERANRYALNFGNDSLQNQCASISQLSAELYAIVSEQNIVLERRYGVLENLLTYALFPKPAIEFFKNRQYLTK